MFDFILNSQADTNGSTRVDRLREPRLLNPVIQQNWTFFGIHKRPAACSAGSSHVQLGLRKWFRQAGFIDMGIEMVPADIGKIDNVRFGNGVLQLLPYAQ